MAKINRMQTVTSLQPDERNGHRPPITSQFWGNKSKGVRGTRKGPGKKIEYEEPPKPKEWYKNLIVLDEKTLKPVKPVAKPTNWTAPKDKTITLDQLIAKFQKERNA